MKDAIEIALVRNKGISGAVLVLHETLAIGDIYRILTWRPHKILRQG
jgi:hypothetical protein